MEIKAVVDRWEEDKAILLVGETETRVVWPRNLLPKATEGDILAIHIDVDTVATQQARAEADELFEQILRQNNGEPGNNKE